MRHDLSQKLTKSYPNLYKHPYTGTEIEAFSFECEDGWYDIINLLSQIVNHHDNDKECRVIQVKEKFGTLRYYLNYEDDYLTGAIEMAELMSSKICEVCGNPGDIRGGGWVKTLCDPCCDDKGYPKE